MAAGPSFPAASATLSWMLPEPARVTPVQFRAVPDTEPLTSVQVAPPSAEPRSFSPAARGASSEPVTVCAAVLVTKSPSTALSAEISRDESVVVGAAVSSV